MSAMIDMGYDEFAKREELSQTLAFSVVKGLCSYDGDWLLCDFSGGEKKYDAHTLLAYAVAFSRRLSNFKKGSRVGVAIPPSFLAFVVNYACVFSGLKPINLNFTLGEVAAKSCIDTAEIKTIITASGFREKISKANPKFPWTDDIVDALEIVSKIPQGEIGDIIRDAKSVSPEEFANKYAIDRISDNNKEATLVFTSGSEGAPKGAILTERNIIANCLQTRISEVFKDDILLANLPIFHSFGLLFESWYMAIHGQKTVTLFTPLDIKNNIRAVREMGITSIIGSPTFFRAYLKHASADDMKTLRQAIAGAEKTPKGFHELWNNAFGDTYREGYGLTEASPVVGVNCAEKDFGYFSTGSRKGAIGKLFPGMRAKVVNPATLEALPFGEQGLLAMAGPNIFAGYLNNPRATQASLQDGWLVTGDLARLDEDGFLYIDGRVSRFSKIGGEMVPHATVESAINNVLGLADTDVPLIAISSRLDEGKGEALVLLSATDITLADAKEALRKSGISNLWHPKYLVQVDKIPLLPSGKLDLKRISDLAK